METSASFEARSAPSPYPTLGWQRAGWRAYWRWRSSRQARGGRPAIRGELQALIGRMAAENRLWGQKRIQAELARSGLQVSTRTVAKYMRVCRSRGPTGCGAQKLVIQQRGKCGVTLQAQVRRRSLGILAEGGASLCGMARLGPTNGAVASDCNR
jgi:hypothetical protein